jgi:hypothetical protein
MENPHEQLKAARSPVVLQSFPDVHNFGCFVDRELKPPRACCCVDDCGQGSEQNYPQPGHNLNHLIIILLPPITFPIFNRPAPAIRAIQRHQEPFSTMPRPYRGNLDLTAIMVVMMRRPHGSTHT